MVSARRLAALSARGLDFADRQADDAWVERLPSNRIGSAQPRERLSAEHDDKRLDASRTITARNGLVCVLLCCAVSLCAASTAASADQTGLIVDAAGCLRAPGTPIPASSSTSPIIDWQRTAAGDRLLEDDCGNVWTLWFNSWGLLARGQLNRLNYISLPKDGVTGPLSASGVVSFLPAAGELWVLGRRGEIARYREGRWNRLPSLPGCYEGDLQRFDGGVWIACGAGDDLGVRLWSERLQQWQDQNRGQPRALTRLAAFQGRLLAAGGEGLFELAPQSGWRRLAQPAVFPTVLAVGTGRIYIGSHQGLRWFDADGGTLGSALDGQRITGIAPNERGGVWVSVWNAGLYYFDGALWQSWTYAQGLPDDQGRDVLLDRQGRLWLGSTSTGVIDERAALARLFELRQAARIPGQVFADACAAAVAVLGERGSAGQIAQAHRDGQHLVFFNGRQVCPNPMLQSDTATTWFRRPADGALLSVSYNGRRGGSRSCGVPCPEAHRGLMTPYWQIRIDTPSTAAPDEAEQVVAPPEPLPLESPSGDFLLTLGGEIWLGTHSSGLYQYDGERWVRHAEAEGFGPQNRIHALAEDAWGNVWVASTATRSSDAGTPLDAPVHRWRDGRWRHWSTRDGLPSAGAAYHIVPVSGGVAVAIGGSLSVLSAAGVETVAGVRGHVSTLAVDAADYGWIGYGSMREGISLMHGKRMAHLDSRQGLFADRIQAIAVDADRGVWMLDDRGRVAVYSRFDLLERMGW